MAPDIIYLIKLIAVLVQLKLVNLRKFVSYSRSSNVITIPGKSLVDMRFGVGRTHEVVCVS